MCINLLKPELAKLCRLVAPILMGGPRARLNTSCKMLQKPIRTQRCLSYAILILWELICQDAESQPILCLVCSKLLFAVHDFFQLPSVIVQLLTALEFAIASIMIWQTLMFVLSGDSLRSRRARLSSFVPGNEYSVLNMLEVLATVSSNNSAHKM